VWKREIIIIFKPLFCFEGEAAFKPKIEEVFTTNDAPAKLCETTTRMR